MYGKLQGGNMIPRQEVWCAKCYLRIAPYDLRTVYQGTDYHQHCFMKLVNEEAEAEKMKRSTLRLVRKDGNEPVRTAG